MPIERKTSLSLDFPRARHLLKENRGFFNAKKMAVQKIYTGCITSETQNHHLRAFLNDKGKCFVEIAMSDIPHEYNSAFIVLDAETLDALIDQLRKIREAL